MKMIDAEKNSLVPVAPDDNESKKVDAKAYVGTGAIDVSKKSFADNNIENSDVDFVTNNTFKVEDGGKLVYKQSKSAETVYAEHDVASKKLKGFTQGAKNAVISAKGRTPLGKLSSSINTLKAEQAEYNANKSANKQLLKDANMARKDAIKDAKATATINKIICNSNRFNSAVNMQIANPIDKSNDLSK